MKRIKRIFFIVLLVVPITGLYAHVIKDVYDWNDVIALMCGDFKYKKTDVLVDKVFNLTRYYNSANKHKGIFGKGWTANIEATYYISSTGTTVVRIGNTEYSLFPLAQFDVSTDDEIRRGIMSVHLNQFRYTFDSMRRLISVRNYSTGDSMNLKYDEFARVHSMTDKYGRTITIFYNSNGLVQAVADPYERMGTYEYDLHGNLVFAKDSNGICESYTYDSNNRLIGIGGADTIPLTRIKYNFNGKVVSMEKDNGITETYNYNNIDGGELKIVQQTRSGIRKEIVYHNTHTKLEVEVLGEKNDTSASYTTRSDKKIMINSIADYMNEVVQYDTRRNIIKKRDCCGQVTAIKYDFWNNPIEIKKNNGQIIYFIYDSQRNLVQIQEVKNGISDQVKE